MSKEGISCQGGALIARSVRELARQARRVLSDSSMEFEARELLGSIELLEQQLDPSSSEALGRWLASLRRRVEAVCLASV